MVKRLLLAGALMTLVVIGVAISQLPAYGAGALLFPSRHINPHSTPAACSDRNFFVGEITLAGWDCRPANGATRGTIVYLHGVADNRGSAIGAIQRLVPLGYNVIAYDSRGHGTSGGDRCTYGFTEKRDLQHVLDQAGVPDVILIGHSLGAAVALQAAAIEPRVRAVVAASSFSDLRTIATERAMFFPAWSLGPAFNRAERDGNFVVDQVSPVKAAAAIKVPVLLVHGAQDRDTLPSHSQRVLDALRAPKKLITVPNAGHNDVLRSEVWEAIESWLDAQSLNSGRKTAN